MAKEQVVADDTEETEREPTLRETIEAARDEIAARQENTNANADAGNATSDAGANTEGHGTSSRTPDGRFARSKPTNDTNGNTGAPSGTAQNQGGGSTSDSTVQQQPVSAAPQSWKAEEKALWSKVPADVQAVINRRENDYRTQITRQGQVAAVGNEFMQVANEYAPLVQARGGNPVAMFKDFMRIMSQIHNAPDAQSRASVFQQVAAQQGVDLRVLGIAPQTQVPNQQAGQLPPQPQIPIQQLVEQAVNGRMQAWQAQQQQMLEQQEMQQASNEIEAFRTKANDQGEPLYPHFDKVTSLMTSIIQSGVASTLEEAYPLAVRAHPETSKLLADAEQAAAKKAEEQRQAAEKARRKAGSVRGSTGSAAAANGAGERTLREELQAGFAAARGRV